MSYISGQEKFKGSALSGTCGSYATTQLKRKINHAVKPEKNNIRISELPQN